MEPAAPHRTDQQRVAEDTHYIINPQLVLTGSLLTGLTEDFNMCCALLYSEYSSTGLRLVENTGSLRLAVVLLFDNQ